NSSCVLPPRQRISASMRQFRVFVRYVCLLCLLTGTSRISSAAEVAFKPTGTFNFKALDESLVPPLFRLESAEGIVYEQRPISTSATAFTIREVTFPS